MSEGQEHLRTSRKIAFGMIIVLGIIGALLGYSIHGGNRTENEDALGLRFPSVMSTPIPQIISDSRDVSLLSSMDHFDVRLDSPSLSRHALPSVLPDRFFTCMRSFKSASGRQDVPAPVSDHT